MDQQKPESIRSYIVERYRTFRRDAFPQYQSHFANLAHTQNPKVLFIACSDSRVVPTMLLSGLPGDIFECRIVGNIVPAYGSAFGGVSATLEYAISVLKVEAVIICGHSDCGAMKALQAVEKYESVKPISTWLHNADAARRITDRYADATNQREYLQALTRENVLAQLENAKTHPAVAEGRRHGLALLGWVYDIETGAVECYDERSKQFLPLEQLTDTVD